MTGPETSARHGRGRRMQWSPGRRGRGGGERAFSGWAGALENRLCFPLDEMQRAANLPARSMGNSIKEHDMRERGLISAPRQQDGQQESERLEWRPGGGGWIVPANADPDMPDETDDHRSGLEGDGLEPDPRHPWGWPAGPRCDDDGRRRDEEDEEEEEEDTDFDELEETEEEEEDLGEEEEDLEEELEEEEDFDEFEEEEEEDFDDED